MSSPLAALLDALSPASTLRLGVTGLSRAGKTVFITGLVRNLLRGGRLPFFAALAEGRVIEASLQPQDDDRLPRFDYEAHLERLARDPPEWPEGTQRISALRLEIVYEPAGFLARQLGPRHLVVDLIDYPGEWLIDLALMQQSYAAWAAGSFTLARAASRARTAAAWLEHARGLSADAGEDEQVAIGAARQYTAYLAAARANGAGLSTLSPGRFLMPGDLLGSPLLTFAPLDVAADAEFQPRSLGAMMQRRFESYKAHVVRPFFRDHFARLDRQIVLVDVLAALNGGAEAVEELTAELSRCLAAFKPGQTSWLAALLGARRVERLLFAATKADHLHHSSHDRLESALGEITAEAIARAKVAGASVGVLALAALRSTREIEVEEARGALPCVVGVPLPGEVVAGRRFDGRTEAVVFPGDLPAAGDGRSLAERAAAGRLEVVRFRPVRVPDDRDRGRPSSWPHVRLDRALEFLLGDKLT